MFSLLLSLFRLYARFLKNLSASDSGRISWPKLSMCSLPPFPPSHPDLYEQGQGGRGRGVCGHFVYIIFFLARGEGGIDEIRITSSSPSLLSPILFPREWPLFAHLAGLSRVAAALFAMHAAALSMLAVYHQHSVCSYSLLLLKNTLSKCVLLLPL